MRKIRNFILAVAIIVIALAVVFRIFFGIFVIRPIGPFPTGSTIIYLRYNTDMPFISSPDGLLMQTEEDVSLPGRLVMIAKYGWVIKDRAVAQFDYSETLYRMSTGEKRLEKKDLPGKHSR